MSRVFLSLLAAWGVLLSASALAGDTYCIYVRSRVTGEEKVHTCRYFNSLEACQKAAERIDGYCGAKR